MLIFRGIRYARAELFSKPVQTDLPEGFDFDNYVPDPVICPQTPSRLSRILGDISNDLPMSLDCLRVSIFTPDLSGKRSVMVFLHGGAYMTGSGEYDCYDASKLASEGDMIVVNVSYRLGAFGFLYQPEKDSVNLGLEDQICALRWVRDNISRFGGDPQKVTLCGQSAGAYSVLNIIARKTGLFHRAIIISAPYALRARKWTARRVRKRFFKYLEGNDIPSLLKAQQEAQKVGQIGMPFMPVGEKTSIESVCVPCLKDVFLICQKDDASAFVPGRILSWIATYFIFRAPMYRYAGELVRSGINARSLELDWRPEGSRLGACHTLELPLLFGHWENWKDAPMLKGVTAKELEPRGRALRYMVSKFVTATYL